MSTGIQLGLDTFGDVTVDLDGTPSRPPRWCATPWSRACSPTGSAWTRSASASTTATTTPSPRRTWC